MTETTYRNGNIDEFKTVFAELQLRIGKITELPTKSYQGATGKEYYSCKSPYVISVGFRFLMTDTVPKQICDMNVMGTPRLNLVRRFYLHPNRSFKSPHSAEIMQRWTKGSQAGHFALAGLGELRIKENISAVTKKPEHLAEFENSEPATMKQIIDECVAAWRAMETYVERELLPESINSMV